MNAYVYFRKSAVSARTGRDKAAALQRFQRKRRICRQLADAVAMGLAAGEASEMHPERGTGFASAVKVE